MWTITCKYFGTNPDGALKAKLLKCGREHALARRDAPIIINEAWISRSHGKFIVGPYSEDDVYNLDSIPTLEYAGTKPFKIVRGDELFPVEKDGVRALHHGEALLVSNKTIDSPIIVWWTDLVCLVDDINVISAKHCAEMGMKVALDYNPKITHLVTDQITGEPNQLPVLLHGGAIVNKRWTQELVRRSDLPLNLPESDIVSLEENCLQPPPEDYLPILSPNLKRAYHQKGLWAPRHERKNLFNGRHFVFLTEGSILPNVWRNVVTAGNGTCETFDVHQGVQKWSTHLALSLRKSTDQDTTLVLVTDESNMDSAVGERWKEFIRETQRIGLRFLPYEKITEAVLVANKELLLSKFDPGQLPSQLPKEFPASFPEDPSSIEPSQPAVRRIRRAPSATPSIEPARSISEAPPSQDEEGLPSRSKLLRRRVRENSAEPTGDQPTTLNRSLLRRRNPTQASQVGYAVQEESILDKHRKLFEETDPDRQMSQSQAPGASTGGRSLTEMVEEADRQRIEALEKALAPTRKRKAHESIEEEAERDEPEAPATNKPRSRAGSRSGSAAPPSKKRALQRAVSKNLDAVEEDEEPAPSETTKPKKSSKVTNKGPTQVDKDERFLVALASMKKNKKKEEQTDRDFNSLKISKPVAEDPDIDMMAWEMLPKDMDLRGNFMVCVENVEVRQNTQSSIRKEGNPAWVGRPDFKKFRKKVPAKRTGVVELVANLPIDDAFEEEEVVKVESDQDFDLPHAEIKGKGKGRVPRTQVIALSDNEGSQEVDGFSGRTAAPVRSTNTRTQQKQPLFLPDSDEEEMSRFKSVDQSDPEDTPKGKGKSVVTKRKAIVLAASSSEDEAYDKRRKKRK